MAASPRFAFELAIGANEDNELYRGVGFYVNNELE